MSDSNSQNNGGNNQSNQTNESNPSEGQRQLLEMMFSLFMNQQSQSSPSSLPSDANSTPLPSNDSLLERFGERMNEEQMNEVAARLLSMENVNYHHNGPPPTAPRVFDELDEFYLTKEDKNILKKECGICSENFRVGEHCKKLPCKHWFHTDECLLPWLSKHNTCPICRHQLPTLDYEYEEEQREKRRQQKKDESADNLSMMYM
eukprot:TRINITY_DN656_c2_g1_i1.p1 TRINITY_DN656_c2_g1~~TRINITY_DN656_c2_g1_i1.p1  ORF type:complete len:204 (+),score=72.69 TRINITY_DN656_c2_g1_i1:164-775(+)